MANWVSWGGAWYFIADMGPYIGAWPLLPPAVIDAGADTSPEFDFFVALPNPAAPTDASVVDDGTYDTPLWDAYRYVYDPGPPVITATGYYGGYDGPTLPHPPVPATPPAGVHLYVVYYPGTVTGPPPNPPEYYVPASYATGGAAAFETAIGHWSDPQSPWTQDVDIAAHAGDAYYVGSSVTYPGDHNVVSAASSQIAAMLSSTPTAGGTSPTIGADKWNVTSPFGPPTFKTDVNVFADIAWNSYDGAPTLAADHPPALSSLINGVDYSNTPYIGADGTAGQPYEYTATPGWAWEAGLANGLQGEQYADGTGGSSPTGEPLPLQLEMRVQWLPGLTVAGQPVTFSGNLMEDRVDTPVGTGSILPWATDYSPVASLQFVVTTSPVFLYTGSIANLADFAMPSLGGHAGFMDWQGTATSEPRLHVDRSSWRYWVPGAIVPVASQGVLRLNQRNDSLGIFQHPRLSSASNLPNRATSVQAGHSPRIPQNPNTYS